MSSILSALQPFLSAQVSRISSLPIKFLLEHLTARLNVGIISLASTELRNYPTQSSGRSAREKSNAPFPMTKKTPSDLHCLPNGSLTCKYHHIAKDCEMLEGERQSENKNCVKCVIKWSKTTNLQGNEKKNTNLQKLSKSAKYQYHETKAWIYSNCARGDLERNET